jgi:hypothetical protein
MSTDQKIVIGGFPRVGIVKRRPKPVSERPMPAAAPEKPTKAYESL